MSLKNNNKNNVNDIFEYLIVYNDNYYIVMW